MRTLVSKFGGVLLLAAFVSSCGAQQVDSTGVLPTVAPIFGDGPSLRPTPTALSAAEAARVPTASARPTAERVFETVDVQVYEDALTKGWNLSSSVDMKYDVDSAAVTYQSEAAVEAIPTEEFGSLIFGVARSAPRNYKREDVLGVRFRVSGGEAILPNDGLIVTVYGSKTYPYYVPGDRSATPPEGRIEGDEPLFPETRQIGRAHV